MKRHLLMTAALVLVLPEIAQAQAQDRHRPAEANRPATARPSPGARPGMAHPSPVTRPAPSTRPSPPVGMRPPGRPGGPQVQPPRPGNGMRPPQPHRPGKPHRPGAGRPPHFKPVHGRPFHYPRGYRYRRWTVGLLLPSLFLSSAYYYDQYAAMGVGPPPPGYRWVRYGPDLLLVQVRTGRIADVIYGAFY